jgi:hypothetical protein
MGQIQIDFINAAGSLRLTFWFGIHPLVSLLRLPIVFGVCELETFLGLNKKV